MSVYSSTIGVPQRMAAYGRGTGSIWMSYVDCTGLESHLGQCGYKPWGKNTCSHGEDAGVMCVPETCKHGCFAIKYLRLIQSSTIIIH